MMITGTNIPTTIAAALVPELEPPLEVEVLLAVKLDPVRVDGTMNSW